MHRTGPLLTSKRGAVTSFSLFRTRRQIHSASLNTNALKAYFGDTNVTGDLATGITINANSKELPEKAWVVDMILRGALKRIVIPCGKVTTTESITYSDGEAVGLGITVAAYPDSSGNTHYEYIKTISSTT